MKNTSENIDQLRIKYSKPLFDRLLVKTDLEIYTDNIYEKLIYIKSKGKYPLGQNINSEAEELHYYYNKLQEKKKMIQLILFLKNDTSGELLITFENEQGRITSNDTFIQQLILKSLIDEYKERKYHIAFINEEEAYDIIMQLKDLDWVRNYFSNSGFFILRDDLVEEISGSEYLSIFKKDKDIFVDIVSEPFYNEDGVHIPIEYDVKKPEQYIDELDIVFDYIKDHKKINDITTEYLIDELNIIEAFKPIINKPKPKNFILYLLISYLLNIKTGKTRNVKMTREECRQIHDVLVFFDFIDDINAKPEKERNTTTPETYIRSIYDYHSKNQLK